MKILKLGLILGLLSSCSTDKTEHRIYNTIRTTAYTHSESDHIKYGRKTAIGTELIDGVIASDWSIFPLNTVLRIDNKIYTVEDFGSALVKPMDTLIPTVDIYTISKYKMRKWGVRFFEDAEIVEFGSYADSLAILKQRLKYQHCREMYNRIQVKL